MIRRPAHARAGFSLVELLVVVAILGMLAGVATISWRSVLPRTALNTDVRVLASRLSATRSDAISRNAIYQIVYDIDNDRYWVRPPFDAEGHFEPNEEERAQLFMTPLRQGVRLRQVTIDGETYDDGLVKVRFDPLGASNDHTVVLHHEPFDRYHTIEVLALTGLLRFHDGIVEREAPSDGDFN